MKKLSLLFLLWTLPLEAAILQQSTAIQVVTWFSDASTGAPKTGITVTSVTCRYVKQDMTTASFNPTASAGSNDMVEIGNGAYRLELTAAQLDTAGPFELGCSISGSVSPPTVYDIYPTATYSKVIGGSPSTIDDLMETDCSTVASTTSAMGKICQNMDGAISTGWMQKTTIATLASQTSFTLTAGSPNNSSYLNAVAVINSASDATLKAQATISAYTGATKTVTLRIDPAIYTMAAGDTITIYQDRAHENLMATTFEGTETFKHFLQYGAAMLFNKYNSSGGVFNFRDLADTKNRVVMTTTATSRAPTLSPD